MNLYDWTKQYILFKDTLIKKIKKIDCLEKSILVEEKIIKKEYYVVEKLENHNLQNKEIKQTKEKKIIISVLNTKSNIDYLIEKWAFFSENEITIMFAHPGTNEKWIIHPKTHNKIVEKEKLKSSIKVLFNSVTRI